MRRVFVDPEAPQRDAIEEAATWILRGGLVALPTDTLYGLAVDPFSSAAVTRLFEAKGRPTDRALPLIAANRAQVADHLGRLSPAAERLAARFWPGPLTLLVAAPSAIARSVSSGTGAVGVRVPADEVARRICAACGHPVTATSANVSGQPATADPAPAFPPGSPRTRLTTESTAHGIATRLVTRHNEGWTKVATSPFKLVAASLGHRPTESYWLESLVPSQMESVLSRGSRSSVAVCPRARCLTPLQCPL